MLGDVLATDGYVLEATVGLVEYAIDGEVE